MIFGELALSEAEGAVLAHGIMLDGRRLMKGTIVDSAMVAAARAAGISGLWVARLEPGDVAEGKAASRIGSALAGTGVGARTPVHGRARLYATHDGLLDMTVEAINRANRLTDSIGIATLPPMTPVCAGDLVATAKVIPFAIPESEVAELLACHPLIEVAPWQRDRGTVLIQTQTAHSSRKMMDKTAAVTRERLHRFGWELTIGAEVAHAEADLASALGSVRNKASLILIAGATATADHADIVPSAIRAAGGTVDRLGMPVDPGNLLVLGRFNPGAVIIGLPGCAKSPKRNGLDLVLERLAAGRSIAIQQMGVGGLLEESGRPVPWAWNG